MFERICDLQAGLAKMWPFALAAVVISHGEERGKVSEIELGAARIALMALHARATGFVPKRLLVRVNTSRSTTFEEAAKALVAYPKPARCTSTLDDSVLLVTCELIRDARLLLIQRENRERWTHSWTETAHAMGLRAGNSLFLVRGPAGSVLVPLSAIQTFLGDYRLYYAFAFLDADPEARAQGADAVIELRNSRGVRIVP